MTDNERLIKLQNEMATIINRNKQKNYEANRVPFPEKTEKMNWTELKLKYLDSLIQYSVEKEDSDVKESIDNLINLLDETLVKNSR